MNEKNNYKNSVRYKNAPLWNVDPYKSVPSMNVNLGKLIQYAKSVGKEVYDLTDQEIELIRNNQE